MINRNGQLWRFIDRYCSRWFIKQVNWYGIDVCGVVRAFFVAALKCAGITALACLALAMAITPWYTLYLTGGPFIPNDFSGVGFLSFGGTLVQGFIVIALVAVYGIALIGEAIELVRRYRHEHRKPYVYKEPKEPSELVKVVKAYYEGLKGKYCLRVELTDA
jgi:hypothetical protein